MTFVFPYLFRICSFLLLLFQELRGLLHDLLRKESKGACVACGGDTNEKLRLEVKNFNSCYSCNNRLF